MRPSLSKASSALLAALLVFCCIVTPNTGRGDTPGSGKIIRLQPTSMPPSRTYCILEDPDGGFGATVEWDPLLPKPLTRDVRVPEKYLKKLRLTCYSEAIRPTITPEKNLAWTFCSAPEKTAPSPKKIFNAEENAFCAWPDKLSKTLDTCTGDDPKAPVPGIEVTLLKVESGTSTFVIHSLPPATGVSGLRSFGLPDEAAVNEIFQAIAEVVVEKARDRGMRVLEKQLKTLVCEQPVSFTRTCAALGSLRLDDLASSGTQLLTALTGDIVERIGKELPKGLPLHDELVQALTLAIDMTTAPERARGAGVTLLLKLLNRVDTDANANFTDLKLLVEIIKDCNRSEACSLDDIRLRLQKPESYYGSGFTKLEWATAPTFITVALKILQPSAGTTEAEQLRASVGLLLDYGEYTCKQAKTACAWPPGVARLGDLIGGILERDVGRILVGGVELIFDSTGEVTELRRLAQIGGALGAFLTTSTSGRAPSEEEQKARRESRKRALSSLIDTFGDRSHRRGDAIFSLGSELFSSPIGYAYLSDPPTAELGQPHQVQITPVSLNLGFAFDWSDAKSGVGLHAAISPFDLGGYLSLHNTSEVVSTPTPGDVLRPSFTLAASYLWEDANLVTILGADVGYQTKFKLDSQAPDDGKRGAVFVGLVAGVYVPILDFN